MKILGISSFYHDSSASLIVDGNIEFCIQEERLTRIKNDNSFPANSIRCILKNKNLTLSDIDYIVFYEKPFLKFNRLIETYLSYVPSGFKQFAKSMPLWLKEKLYQKLEILNELKKIDHKFDNLENIFFSDHHMSHAASAFYPSPFEKSLVLTIDGVGEWSTTTVCIGNRNKIEKKFEILYPHSLGLLYSAFTLYCGFEVNEGEYKLMGLAPYGKPKYEKVILNELIDLKEDGSFNLNMDYFDFCVGFSMINEKFVNLFGKPIRSSLDENNIDQFYMDIAASIQKVIEKAVLKMCKYFKSIYDVDNLCLAGGVALNCVANGKIIDENIFNKVWVQPASGDAGGSLGAALNFWYSGLENERKFDNKNDQMSGSYLGPNYTNEYIKFFLEKNCYKFKYIEDDILFNEVAKLIYENKVIGWFQDRMEFGPRALGNRSILGNPCIPKMQSLINQKVKFRESFRPFAPAILKHFTSDWFNLKVDSPYMLFVSQINNKKKKINLNNNIQGLDKLKEIKSDIPAVTHVDFSARVQTVDEKNNLKFFKLIKSFYELSGIPVLINTSFNVRGEPIVCSPEDAFRCFLYSDIDFLVLGNFLLDKSEQFYDENCLIKSD